MSVVHTGWTRKFSGPQKGKYKPELWNKSHEISAYVRLEHLSRSNNLGREDKTNLHDTCQEDDPQHREQSEGKKHTF